MAQTIAMNPQASIPVQTLHNLIQSAKAADPKPFDRNWDQTKEFIRAIQIAVTMQADTFVDKRMKILYALLFMHGGTAQVWEANETMAVMTHNWDISDAHIGHLSGQHQKDFQRPRLGMDSLHTASQAQNDTWNHSRRLYSSVRDAHRQIQF